MEFIDFLKEKGPQNYELMSFMFDLNFAKFY